MVWVSRDGFQEGNVTDESKEDVERRKKVLGYKVLL